MKNIHYFDIPDITVTDINWVYEKHKDVMWEFNTTKHKKNDPQKNVYEIFFVTSGSFSTKYYDGHRSKILKNALILKRHANINYISSSMDLPYHYYSIYFNTLEPIDPRLFDYQMKYVYPKHIKKVEELFVNAFNLFLEKPDTWKIDIKSIVLHIFSIFLNECSMVEEKRYVPVYMKKAMKIINEKIYDENINIGELANELNISIDYFSRLFKKTYGTTPKKYILDIKLDHAATLLYSTDKTLTEICEQSGFFNISYFNVAFKEKYGISPGQYRRQRKIY